MARRPHAHVGEHRESSKAWTAWTHYRDMPEGQRSLSNLVQYYRTSAESPPTRSLERLKCWSTIFHWQARLAAWQAELDHARRQEALRQTERQARENAALMQAVGAGSLGVCAQALNRLIDPRTGELTARVEPRDLCGLMKAGSELLALATNSPTQIIGNGDATQLERCLRESDEQTRAVVLRGLRAALAWSEQQRNGGAA